MTETGIGAYSGRGATSAPQRVFSKLLEKTRLKAALAAVQADIDAAVPTLSPSELAELRALMANEVEDVDADVEALRAEVEKEAQLAKVMKPMQVQIPRRAAAVLAAEVERRIARGVYPSAEALVGEAVAIAFAGGRP